MAAYRVVTVDDWQELGPESMGSKPWAVVPRRARRCSERLDDQQRARGSRRMCGSPTPAAGCHRHHEQHCEPKPNGHSSGELSPAHKGRLARHCC